MAFTNANPPRFGSHAGILNLGRKSDEFPPLWVVLEPSSSFRDLFWLGKILATATGEGRKCYAMTNPLPGGAKNSGAPED